MTVYFNSVQTLEELRKQYKELLKKYHPDNPNGSTKATQKINTEYERLFKDLKHRHYNNATDSQTSNENMKYDYTEDEKLRNMLQKIIHFSDITIEICGYWIWLSGNTYQYRKALKEFGFKWASKKHQWYWHSEVYVKKSRKTLSMDDIRNYYGSTEVYTHCQMQLSQA